MAKIKNEVVGKPCDGDKMPLNELNCNETATIIDIDKNPIRIRKLAALGILPGNDVLVIRKYPAILIEVGYSQIALDEEIASKIIVCKK